MTTSNAVFRLLGATFLTACSAGTSTPNASVPPTIAISSPTDGPSTKITLGTDTFKAVPIAFSVSNFTLKAPGTCAGAPSCGHVHLLIDADGCKASQQPYNNAGVTSPINAQFVFCQNPEGKYHEVTLELHNDDHSPVLDTSNKVIAKQVGFETD